MFFVYKDRQFCRKPFWNVHENGARHRKACQYHELFVLRWRTSVAKCYFAGIIRKQGEFNSLAQYYCEKFRSFSTALGGLERQPMKNKMNRICEKGMFM